MRDPDPIPTIRLAAAFYGGNARMPFEAGVAFALLELLVASRLSRGQPVPPGFDWLTDVASAALPDVRFDIIAGASAGGVVGAILTKMLTDSDDPIEDFRQGASVWVDQMDADNMAASGIPDDPAEPASLFDKRRYTTEAMRELMATHRAGGLPPLAPECGLWLSLTRPDGVLDVFRDPDGQGRPVLDLRYLDVRGFDRVDFLTRPEAIIDAVEATSASPFAFAAHYVADNETPEGHVDRLRARAEYDLTVPDGLPELEPPIRVPAYDGGARDNRPTGVVVDAILRQGLGLGRGEQLVALLIDPTPDRRPRTEPIHAVGGERRRWPALADQTASARAAAGLLLHDRVSDDLYRLLDWQVRAGMVGKSGYADRAPGPSTCAAAAERLLFGRRLSPDSTLGLNRPGLALTLAARDHVARRPLMAIALRIRSLVRMRDRLLVPQPGLDAQAVERRRATITAVLHLEVNALNAAVDPRAEPTAAELRHLVMEATAGIPLPRPDGPRRIDLTVRRIGPPEDGLASWAVGGVVGFFDPTYRAHDLITGIITGRRAIAALLTGDARARWKDAFGLHGDDATAAAWFDRADSLPWRRWAGEWHAVRDWRGPDWATLDREARLAREMARFHPRAAGAVAHIADRLWLMAASAGADRDFMLYRMMRGRLGAVARLVVAPLSRRAARRPGIEQEADWFGSIRRTGIALGIGLVAYLAGIATIAALAFGAPVVHTLSVLLITALAGLAIPVAVMAWHRRQVDAVPRVPVPPLDDRPPSGLDPDDLALCETGPNPWVPGDPDP